MKLQLLIPILLAGVLLGCAQKEGDHRPITNRPSVGTQTTNSSISFAQIQSIFASRCSRCHPASAPRDWSIYETAAEFAKNGKLLARVVVERTMPPLGSPEATAMTDAERGQIAAWIKAGAPKFAGAAKDKQTRPGPGSGKEPKKPVTKNKWQVLSDCTACHGDFGHAKVPQVPNLAGQKQTYLATEIRNFQSGKRKDLILNAMNTVTKGLDPKTIQFLAKFFSSLPPVHNQQKQDPVLVETGKRLNEEYSCSVCHLNEKFESIADTMPNLYGQNEAYLFLQLKAFQQKKRTGDTMTPLLADAEPPLTEDDLKALAHYFATIKQSPPDSETSGEIN